MSKEQFLRLKRKNVHEIDMCVPKKTIPLALVPIYDVNNDIHMLVIHLKQGALVQSNIIHWWLGRSSCLMHEMVLVYLYHINMCLIA